MGKKTVRGHDIANRFVYSLRELNTPLFLLRCCQVGISIRDLDLLTVGMVMDMFTEQQNDSYKYPRMATQEDFNKF